MLQIKPTPNYAGVTITGDFEDFDQLYESLHMIVGTEDEHSNYFDTRIRVLGLCYDLRHANMGHRDYNFKDHGLDADTMKWMGVIGPKQNLYLSFNTYLPELLFITMALNDFIDMYLMNKATHRFWDKNVTTVRAFQATFMASLSEVLKPQTFKMMQNNMSQKYGPNFSNYFTAYIDQLNVRFLKWDADKRYNNISIIAKRIAEQGKPYQKVVEQIMEVAREEDCHPSEIRFAEAYPDEQDIDW